MSIYKRYYKSFPNPVFITIVTYNRRNLLIDNIQLLRECIKSSIKKLGYKLIAGVVLKDHMHFIIESTQSELIPKIIQDIKYNFTKNIPKVYLENIALSTSRQKRSEKGVWQRRYYDHIIRNENDFYKHLDYIHYNPTKHYNIAPKDWKYSSFMKFVKQGMYKENWCNLNDKNNINELEIE